MWPEVATAKEEGRRELVITGPSYAQRIETEGNVDETIYGLTSLNFLEISHTPVSVISSEKIGNLVNLTNLVLRGNKIAVIPEGIGNLKLLKYLDFSGNQVETVPESLCRLPELMTLDLRNNKLVSVPSINGLVKIHELFLSGNQLTELPEDIANGEELVHLHTVVASHNEIETIPEGLAALPMLKHLDLSNNAISDVPADLSQCSKLKELNLKGNKLKDRRFLKLVDQCLTKSLLDYLATQYLKEAQSQGASTKKVQKSRTAGAKKSAADEVDKLADEIRVLNFHASSSDGLVVRVTDAVADVRPHIICCIVRHVSFAASLNLFKRFISLQTKLHEGICDNRLACTIATHDMKSVKGPLLYEARNPKTVPLMPLGKQKEQSAAHLMSVLRSEADDVRKEKKRSTLSGIHKYLDLLKDKPLYPFLMDAGGRVISFPPITNCEGTKISRDTTDILIEVTSSKSMAVCKEAMDEILREMLIMGLGKPSGEATANASAAPAAGGCVPASGVAGNPTDGGNPSAAAAASDVSFAGLSDDAPVTIATVGATPVGKAGATATDEGTEAEPAHANPGSVGSHGVQQKYLVVEQVRIVDSAGALKVVYPSKMDLQHPSYVVARP